MRVDGKVRPERDLSASEPLSQNWMDPEWLSIVSDIEALDQYLRIQNLRRFEEESFIQFMNRRENG